MDNGYAGTTNGYQPSNGNPGQSNGHRIPPQTNGYDDHDSNGFDSGQGSSLDRDFNNGVGHYDRYAKTPKQQQPSHQHQQQQQQQQHMVNHSRGQYYYNLPHGGEGQQQQQHGGAAGPAPRKNVGDGLDLSNREYRGSAFELYKKPSLQATTMQMQPLR